MPFEQTFGTHILELRIVLKDTSVFQYESNNYQTIRYPTRKSSFTPFDNIEIMSTCVFIRKVD